MKRPEETKLPFKYNQLESTKRIIEQYIETDVFSFPYHGIVLSPELKSWLEDWGWGIEYHTDCGEESYYTLREL